ncbi:beta-defensin 1 [Ornithorhynchus anatinus]|nr:beta-defensin 1 [Ornithorhynchus anatinus]
MRTLYLLLAVLFLVLSQGNAGYGQRSDSYQCHSKRGTCSFSNCPLFRKPYGTCYNGKAKCCLRR